LLFYLRFVIAGLILEVGSLGQVSFGDSLEFGKMIKVLELGGKMNIILLEKINNLGDIGDTANVKAGFARNFLFPKGKALPATKRNLEDFEGRKAELLAAHDKNVATAQQRAALVEGQELVFEVNASDDGRLFGSIGTRDIADTLNAKVKSDITKAEVSLPNGAIRELGTYSIGLDLGFDVLAKISVVAVALGAAAGVTADGSVIEEIENAEAADALVDAPEE
jgi:large subunit ribosomal protein L9